MCCINTISIPRGSFQKVLTMIQRAILKHLDERTALHRGLPVRGTRKRIISSPSQWELWVPCLLPTRHSARLLRACCTTLLHSYCHVPDAWRGTHLASSPGLPSRHAHEMCTASARRHAEQAHVVSDPVKVRPATDPACHCLPPPGPPHISSVRCLTLTLMAQPLVTDRWPPDRLTPPNPDPKPRPNPDPDPNRNSEP